MSQQQGVKFVSFFSHKQQKIIIKIEGEKQATMNFLKNKRRKQKIAEAF